MRYVIFKKIGAKNFKNHIEPINIQIPENGLILITGPNGSGKTSSIQILFFTFFGRTPDGLTSNDVVNNKMDKDCITYVEYDIIEEDGTRDTYKCTRYCKYKSIGNTVILEKNDNTNYKTGHKEVVKEINKLWSRDVFLNTLFFAQEVKNFFIDLQDSDQKQIFRSILRTSDYEVYKKITTEKENDNDRKLNENQNNIQFYQKLIDENNLEIQRLEEKKELFYKQKNEILSNLKNDIDVLEKDKEKYINEKNKFSLDQLNDELKYLNKQKNDIEYKIENLETIKNNELEQLQNDFLYKKQELKTKLNNSKNEIEKKYNNTITKKNSDYSYKNDLLQEEIDKLTKEENSLNIDLNDIKSNIRNIDDNINFFFQNSSKIDSDNLATCPFCREEVNEHTKEKINKEIEILENNKKQLENQIEEIKPKLEKIINDKIEKNENKKELKNNLSKEENDLLIQKEQEINELNKKYNEAIENLNNINNQKIEEIKNKNKNDEIELKQKFEEKNNQIEISENKIANYNELVNEINNINQKLEIKKNNIQQKENEEFDDEYIDNYKDKISKNEELIKVLENEKISLDRRKEGIEFWKKGFSNSGIPSMLIDEAIPFMNKTIKLYLENMTYGRYSVTFDTLKQTKSGDFRDKISINVFDNVTGANHKSQLSGGQSRLIDIATVLTLSDLQSNIQNIKTNLLIFDEIFDSLDNENIDLVSKSLTRLSKDIAIIIISHIHIDHLDANEHLHMYH